MATPNGRVLKPKAPRMTKDRLLPALTTDDVSVGDTIHLKSGGPPMTVERINIVALDRATIDEDKTTIDCVWFTAHPDGGEWSGPSRATFALKLLDSKV